MKQDISKYNCGWRESRDERFERKLRRLALVMVLCAATLATIGITRGLSQRVIHEAGQLPAVATAAPNR